MLEGLNKNLDVQINVLMKILFMNKKLKYLLEILDECNINQCYVGAGCINQTVFNYYHGYDMDYGINDYDIVYFDDDVSYEAEDRIINRISSKVKDKDIRLDIKNQARVYLWYYEKYGVKREPYVSVNDAISKWTSTVTCVGVRIKDGKFQVYAPYGLNDIFGMIIRPVKMEIDRESYEERCKKWKYKWPKLKIISWEGDCNESIDNGG